MVKSPFVEKLLKRGFEVLYLTEPVDEYCLQSLPEFDSKKFQNAAKEGLKLDQSERAKEYREGLKTEYEPLLNWMKDVALVNKVTILINSFCGTGYHTMWSVFLLLIAGWHCARTANSK